MNALTAHGSGLPAWWGRFPLGVPLASLVGTLPAGGSFCSVKRNQNPLRAFPPKDLPLGTRLGLRQV